MSMPEKTQQYFANRIWTIVEIGTNNNHTLEEIDKALEQLQTEMSVVLVDKRIENHYSICLMSAKTPERVMELVNEWYEKYQYDEKATGRITREADDKLRKEGWK